MRPQACEGRSCLEQQLAGLAEAIGAAQGSSGGLVLESGAEIDGSQLADQMFLTELAVFYGGLQAQLQAVEQEAQVRDLVFQGLCVASLPGLTSTLAASTMPTTLAPAIAPGLQGSRRPVSQ